MEDVLVLFFAQRAGFEKMLRLMSSASLLLVVMMSVGTNLDCRVRV